MVVLPVLKQGRQSLRRIGWTRNWIANRSALVGSIDTVTIRAGANFAFSKSNPKAFLNLTGAISIIVEQVPGHGFPGGKNCRK
jgi:hypothetical protein